MPNFPPCKGKIGKLGLGKIRSKMVPPKHFLVLDIDHHLNLISWTVIAKDWQFYLTHSCALSCILNCRFFTPAHSIFFHSTTETIIYRYNHDNIILCYRVKFRANRLDANHRITNRDINLNWRGIWDPRIICAGVAPCPNIGAKNSRLSNLVKTGIAGALRIDFGSWVPRYFVFRNQMKNYGVMGAQGVYLTLICP